MSSCNRRDAKRDANEGEIIRALQKIGARDIDRISMKDRPDLLFAWRGQWRRAEVKMPGEDLSTGQRVFRDAAGAPIAIFRSPYDVVAWANSFGRAA